MNCVKYIKNCFLALLIMLSTSQVVLCAVGIKDSYTFEVYDPYSNNKEMKSCTRSIFGIFAYIDGFKALIKNDKTIFNEINFKNSVKSILGLFNQIREDFFNEVKNKKQKLSEDGIIISDDFFKIKIREIYEKIRSFRKNEYFPLEDALMYFLKVEELKEQIGSENVVLLVPQNDFSAVDTNDGNQNVPPPNQDSTPLVVSAKENVFIRTLAYPTACILPGLSPKQQAGISAVILAIVGAAVYKLLSKQTTKTEESLSPSSEEKIEVPTSA